MQQRFRWILACIIGLFILILASACTGPTTADSASASPTSGVPTNVTATSTPQGPSAIATQPPVTPTATHQPTPTGTTSASSIPQNLGFKAGGISFIGTVRSVNNTTLVAGMANGQTLSMSITAQTDRSDFGGNLPAVGSLVDATTSANPDGSFNATALKSATPGDPDTSIIEYQGITFSAVGADHVVHLQVGTRSYTFTVPSSADLGDFGGNAQSIGNNQSVTVEVQYSGSTATVTAVKNSTSD
ncbi:MAG TPA: hypothetical protein VKR06_19560 [Ktedonosporobacter sp.]|nr:hypothetical protein [Ktedonosporobacter sp.]